MSGLETDSRRQAKDTIRGYVYQILRSIVVWLDLGDSEQLILEGAEDLDRHDDQEVLVEQVKDTIGSGNITLRSSSVLEAINNYWSHRGRNPEINIRFRYLTTSGLGAEQGRLFGNSRGGLSVWSSIRAAPEADDTLSAAASIKDFLLSENAVSDELKAYLEIATPAEIVSTLILPIEWIVGQKDTNGLVRQIKDKLVEYGASVSISPAEAEKAFEPLYFAAFDAAKDKDGLPLTKAEFMRIFAAATTMQVPLQDYTALVRAAASSNANEVMRLKSDVAEIEGRPPLPPRYFVRNDLEVELRSALRIGTVMLQGSTGTGKTLLASSCLAQDTSAGWIMLRDLEPSQVRDRLVLALRILLHQNVPRTIVIDDLDALADPRINESALSDLWSTIRDLGGSLIITSAHALPARLAQAVDLQTEATLMMPPFELDEIESFLKQEGCSSERIEGWSKLIELASLGHPQLINARIATLRAARFPEPAASDLFATPSDINAVRLDARRLIAALPDAARELLYRVSLVSGRMTKQRVMAIARLETAIEEPGIAVDVITGPWLELTDTGDYRVSPLARGATEEARGLPWARAMHGKLAWIYLLERSISPWDISAIMTHCLVAGRTGPLAHLMQSLFGAGEEVWEDIAEVCRMFTAIGIEEPNKLPFSESVDTFIFRLFQYRIAVVGQPETAAKIAACFDAEICSLEVNDGARFFRFVFLAQVLQHTNVTYPIIKLVHYAREFLLLGKEIEETFPVRAAQAKIEIETSEVSLENIDFAALPLMHRITTIKQLDEFLSAIADFDKADKRKLVAALAGPYEQASIIVERFWLAEYRESRNQWTVFRDILKRCFDTAADVDVMPLARAIAPVLVRLIDEEMDDPDAALEEAKSKAEILGNDPALRCAIAKITNKRGDPDRALEIWVEALPRWESTVVNFTCVYAHRDAGIAAGNIGRWEIAAELFDQGHALINEDGTPTFSLGLRIDAAFCRFVAGHHEIAIDQFDAFVEELQPMQADLESEPVLSLQRRFGGILSAINNWNEKVLDDDQLANLAGLCSNLDPFETDVPDPPPLDVLQMDLMRIDIAFGSGPTRALKYATILRKTPFLSLRCVLAAYFFELSRKTGDFANVVADGITQVDAMGAMAEAKAKGGFKAMQHYDGISRSWVAGTEDLLTSYVIAAVFEISVDGELEKLPIDRWRADLVGLSQAGGVLEFVNFLDGLFVARTVDPWQGVLNPTISNWANHLMASLAATKLGSVSPSQLIQCHGLWAHYLRMDPLHQMASIAVSRLVSAQWKEACSTPALLVAPKLNVPAISAAAALPSDDWSKTKTVLKTAIQAVTLASNDQSRAAIEAIEP